MLETSSNRPERQKREKRTSSEFRQRVPFPETHRIFVDMRTLSPQNAVKRLRELIDIMTQNLKTAEGLPPALEELLHTLDQTVSNTWKELLLESKQQYNPWRQRQLKAHAPNVDFQHFQREFFHQHFWTELSLRLNEQNFYARLFHIVHAPRLQKIAEELRTPEISSIPERRRTAPRPEQRGPKISRKKLLLMRFAAVISLLVLVGVWGTGEVSAQDRQGVINQILEKFNQLELQTEPTQLFRDAYDAGQRHDIDFTIQNQNGEMIPFFQIVSTINQGISDGTIKQNFLYAVSEETGFSPEEVSQLIIGYYSGFLGVSPEDLESAWIEANMMLTLPPDLFHTVCEDGAAGCYYSPDPPIPNSEVDGSILVTPDVSLETLLHEDTHAKMTLYYDGISSKRWQGLSEYITVVQFVQNDQIAIVAELRDGDTAIALDFYKLNEWVAEFFSQTAQKFLGISEEGMYGSRSPEFINDVKNKVFEYLVDNANRDKLNALTEATRDFSSNPDLHPMISTLGEVILATTPNFVEEFKIDYTTYPDLYNYIFNQSSFYFILNELPPNEQAGLILMVQLCGEVRQKYFEYGFGDTEEYTTIFVPTHDQHGNLSYRETTPQETALEMAIQNEVNTHEVSLAEEQRNYTLGYTSRELGEVRTGQLFEEFKHTGNIEDPTLTDFQKVSLVVEMLTPEIFEVDTISNTTLLGKNIQQALQSIMFYTEQYENPYTEYQRRLLISEEQFANTYVTVRHPQVIINPTHEHWLFEAATAVQSLVYEHAEVIEAPTNYNGDFLSTYKINSQYSIFDLQNGRFDITLSLLLWFSDNSPTTEVQLLTSNVSLLPDFIAQLNLYMNLDPVSRNQLLENPDNFLLLRQIDPEMLDLFVAAQQNHSFSLGLTVRGGVTRMTTLSQLGGILKFSGMVELPPDMEQIISHPPEDTPLDTWENHIYGYIFWQTFLENLPESESLQAQRFEIVTSTTNPLTYETFHDLGFRHLKNLPLFDFLGLRFSNDSPNMEASG